MNENTWIIIAAYNEEASIGRTIAGLKNEGWRNIIVVDDCSRDQSGPVAREAGAVVLRHLINCGQGAALQTGIEYALGQEAKYLVTFDADGQHSPQEIAQFLKPLEEGHCDITLGSRFLGRTVQMPTSRRIVLKLGVLFTRFVSQIRVTDTHNGLRAMTADAASRIRITQNRMAHASEIIDLIRYHDLRYREVPNTIHYSQQSIKKGQSSWNALKIASQFLLGKVVK